MILENTRERELAAALLSEEEYEFLEMMFGDDGEKSEEWIVEDDQEMVDDLFDRGFVESGEDNYPNLTFLGEMGLIAYRALKP